MWFDREEKNDWFLYLATKIEGNLRLTRDNIEFKDCEPQRFEEIWEREREKGSGKLEVEEVLEGIILVLIGELCRYFGVDWGAYIFTMPSTLHYEMTLLSPSPFFF